MATVGLYVGPVVRSGITGDVHNPRRGAYKYSWTASLGREAGVSYFHGEAIEVPDNCQTIRAGHWNTVDPSAADAYVVRFEGAHSYVASGSCSGNGSSGVSWHNLKDFDASGVSTVELVTSKGIRSFTFGLPAYIRPRVSTAANVTTGGRWAAWAEFSCKSRKE